MPKLYPSAADHVIEEISGRSDRELYTSSGNLDKEVLLNELLLERYNTAERQNWASQVYEDDQFCNNVMWEDTHVVQLEKLGYAPIQVPIIPEIVNYSVGMLTFNSPGFQATAKEDSDVETASYGSDLLAHITYISKGKAEIKRFAYDAFVRSMGAMIIYPDFNMGEVYIKAINPLDVYLPPSCKSRFGEDADHIVIRSYETERQLTMRYPKVDFAKLHKDGKIQRGTISDATYRPSTDRYALQDQVLDDPGDDPDTRVYEVLDRYSKVQAEYHYIWYDESGFEDTLEGEDYEVFLEQPAVTLQSPSAQMPEIVLDAEEVEFYAALGREGGGFFHLVEDPQSGQAEMVPGVEDDISVPGSTVAIGLTTMKELIDAGYLHDDIRHLTRIQRVESAGGYRLYAGLLPISRYPIVTWMLQHNRNPYPISLVRMGKSLNDYINKTRQLIAAHTANSVGQTVLLNTGAGIDLNELKAELSKAGTKIIPIPADEDIRKSIMQLQPLPLSNQLFQDLQTAKQELRDLFGVYQMMQGDASLAPETRGATLALDEYGQRRSKFLLDDFYDALALIGQVAMELSHYVYTEHRVIRLFQPNNKPKMVEINRPIYDEYSGQVIRRVNDVSMVKDDVIVVPGSTLPSNRWAKLEYYLMLWKEKVLRDDETILRESDIQNLDEVIAKHSLISQLQAQLQQAQQDNEDLSGLLQTTRRELLHARERTELEKWKRQLGDDRADMKVDSATQELEFENLRRELKASLAPRAQS